MAEITASMVKELRECTGAGMMECKKALAEADGDLNQAIDVLRTRGLAALAKKTGRAAKEGNIAAAVSDDGKTGVLVEVSSETDFVGRNEEFKSFVRAIAGHILAEAPSDVEVLGKQTHAERGMTIDEMLGEAVGKLGENMGVVRFVRETVTGNGAISTYVHGGGRIGVLVNFAFDKPETAQAAAFQTYAKDVAMQIAAASPQSVRREDIAAEMVEHEMSIYKAQAAESGKPEAIQEKMAQGRMEKFYKEVVLVEQAFVKDPDMTVAAYTDKTGKDTGDTITIASFTRFVLGELAEEAE